MLKNRHRHTFWQNLEVFKCLQNMCRAPFISNYTLNLKMLGVPINFEDVLKPSKFLKASKVINYYG